jgi:hypothetical protein
MKLANVVASYLGGLRKTQATGIATIGGPACLCKQSGGSEEKRSYDYWPGEDCDGWTL